MPIARVKEVDIAYEMAGESGPPLVMVHGSWVGGANWALSVPDLSKSFRVVTYDRRGHNGSSAPGGGKISDDVEDLAGLMAHLGLDRAHIVGGSYGSIVSLRFASAHPELVLSVNVHEPPMVDMLKLDPDDTQLYQSFWADIAPVRRHLEAGRNEKGAEAFVEGLFPGAWATIPEAVRPLFSANGPTFLDELNDPESYGMADAALAGINAPCLLTDGSESPPFFARVISQIAPRISGARRHTFQGAGHVPHQSHVPQFVEKVTKFAFGVE
ncbi:MAG: alpha/beta fold hydrolase [Dehalococcoidia bacterium]